MSGVLGAVRLARSVLRLGKSRSLVGLLRSVFLLGGLSPCTPLARAAIFPTPSLIAALVGLLRSVFLWGLRPLHPRNWFASQFFFCGGEYPCTPAGDKATRSLRLYWFASQFFFCHSLAVVSYAAY